MVYDLSCVSTEVFHSLKNGEPFILKMEMLKNSCIVHFEVVIDLKYFSTKFASTARLKMQRRIQTFKHFSLIFNHKNHSCELPDCVHVFNAFTSIYSLLSCIHNIYKLWKLSDYEQSHLSRNVHYVVHFEAVLSFQYFPTQFASTAKLQMYDSCFRITVFYNLVHSQVSIISDHISTIVTRLVNFGCMTYHVCLQKFFHSVKFLLQIWQL